MKSLFMLAFLFPLFCIASIENDFLALKDNGRNLQDTGAICEEVAQLDMQRKYPSPQFSVLTGIAYSNRNGTVGELDVIIFENHTSRAVLVGEVKCWKDMRGGLMKAYDQRERFLTNIRSSKELHFKWLSDPRVTITKKQFSDVKQFVTIAQKGSRSAGFDLELAYSLNQLMELRHEIIRCQSAGQCKRPSTSPKNF